MNRPPELYIGLMSGTSVDGIDAALVEISSTNTVNVIETQFTPFNKQLRNDINQLAQTNWNIHGDNLTQCSDSKLHTQLAQNYADASLALLSKANKLPTDIVAIANHGQTVRHEPNASPPFSLQLGDGQLIANLTNIKTITQFRQADLAVGGQGAPLMPAFHQAIFNQDKDTKESITFVVNVGGIANISLLGNSVIGYDTGPGNTLLDQWILQHKQCSYDSNGDWASSGKKVDALLQALLSDPYFALPFPKSTGPDYFNIEWFNQCCSSAGLSMDDYKPEDIQHTLVLLTTQSIANSITQLSSSSKRVQVFVCGGGAHNTFMLRQLQEALPNAIIDTTGAIGVPADWVEAVGFAWLGYCFEHGIPSNLPDVTGATKRVILGESFTPI